MRRQRSTVLTYFVLGGFAGLILLPFISLILVSFNARGNRVSGLEIPRPFSIENYIEVYRRANFQQTFSNSLFIASVVVIVTLVLSTLCGYAMGTMRFKFNRFFFYFILMGFVVPVETTIVPLYLTMDKLKLLDTPFAVILPQIGFFLTFGVFWMRSFFITIPASIIEAARIDGANSRQILWKVLLPIAKPAIYTLVVLTFLWSWNELFLSTILLQSSSKLTAPTGLMAFVGQYTTETGSLAAAAIVLSFPIVIIYLIFQRQFISGLLVGSTVG